MLRSWHEAARDVNVPLLIGEGSTDAAAWRYPQIFEEPSFALHEIILYLRILAVSQPRSILQWQLTADYSLLAGGGVFGNDKEPLRPMQRFWNLKQLASTPGGRLPAAVDQQQPDCAHGGLRRHRPWHLRRAHGQRRSHPRPDTDRIARRGHPPEALPHR